MIANGPCAMAFPRDAREIHRRTHSRGCSLLSAQGDEPEFLLVRTRSGRWTFPKGGVDGDATNADAAAREAYEEAGVKGRVEFHRVSLVFSLETRPLSRSRGQLCPCMPTSVKLSDWCRPRKDHRDPTWFNADKARRRLRENRTARIRQRSNPSYRSRRRAHPCSLPASGLTRRPADRDERGS